jgi:hypothetical protein
MANLDGVNTITGSAMKTAMNKRSAPEAKKRTANWRLLAAGIEAERLVAAAEASAGRFATRLRRPVAAERPSPMRPLTVGGKAASGSAALDSYSFQLARTLTSGASALPALLLPKSLESIRANEVVN